MVYIKIKHRGASEGKQPEPQRLRPSHSCRPGLLVSHAPHANYAISPNPALEGWENSVPLIPSISLQKIAIAYGSSWHGELVARFRLPRRVSSFSCAS